MSSEKPRMVVFDLGGVLVRICRTWAEGCVAAGLPVRGDTAAAEMIARRREISARHGVGGLGFDEFCREMSRSLGGMYTAEEVGRIHTAWIIGEYPGAAGLVGELKSRGVTTGVLSNTNAAHWDMQLPAFESLGLVDHPHASHLLGLIKPGQEIYKAFERATGARGAEIVFFDDLEENVAAAKEQGWRAHQVDHTGDTATEMRGVLRELGVL